MQKQIQISIGDELDKANNPKICFTGEMQESDSDSDAPDAWTVKNMGQTKKPEKMTKTKMLEQVGGLS